MNVRGLRRAGAAMTAQFGATALYEVFRIRALVRLDGFYILSPKEVSPKMSQLITFGKYKGKPLATLFNDRQYCEWLQQQPWLQEKFPHIHTLIINNFGEPAETPEHNQVQAMFTDAEFCRRFLLHVRGEELAREFQFEKQDRIRVSADWLEQKRREAQSRRYGIRCRIGDQKAAPNADYKAREAARDLVTQAEIDESPEALEAQAKIDETANGLEELKAAPFAVEASARFEVSGADVLLDYSFVFGGPVRDRNPPVYVECKPSLGDDYPAVLRKLISTAERLGISEYTGMRVLFIGAGGYVGAGASLEQVEAIFASRGVQIAHLNDLAAGTPEGQTNAEIGD